jgi:hypothetical protein
MGSAITGRAVRRLALAAIILAAPFSLAVVVEQPAFAACGVESDFNGDSFADVAIGEPDHADAGGAAVGGLRVIYGSASGLAVSGSAPVANQYFDLASAGMPNPGGDTVFGDALTAGDFDGDCIADLVVGAVGYPGTAGGLVVLHGSPNGLSTADADVFALTDLLPGGPATSPELGRVTAVGDFDGDGNQDLAMGTKSPSAGGVIVLYGSADGLTLARRQLWTQNSTGVVGGNEDNDMFGAALATADFTGDGRDDLVVGAPGESVGTVAAAGSITMIRGSVTGLTGNGSQSLNQNSAGVPGANESGDMFGGVLVAGDVTGDFRPDIVVSALTEDVGNARDCGAVWLIKGTGAGGLSGAGSQLWSQDSAGVPGAGETFDYFGYRLALGNLNGDARADVVIATPYEDVGSAKDAGAVTVLYGAGTGLTSSGAQLWTQSSAGVTGTPETTDLFGWAVDTGRVRSDATESLLIGVPVERNAGLTNVGLVHVLRSGSSGVTATGSTAIKASDLAAGNTGGGGEFGWSFG